VYLSATIDKIDEFEYYSKDIRQMIERGFLCDYTIHIPIFSEDPDNRKICDHLLRNYRNIIIYCNSQKEGKEINRLMNELQNNSCMYIDCNTSKKNRDIITNKYKKSELQFLVNVRILVEGFDAPITKGVCFLHLPKNRTTLIQIIGRALRLHATKTIANIILPFSSKEDEMNICNFLKVMAQNDSRIKKSFESKKIGGYISIEKVEEDTDNEDINSNIEFKYNMIYDSMGRLTNGDEIWMKRFENVKNYIDEHKKRPSLHNKIKTVKKLGQWFSDQIKNYKNKIKSMNDPVKYQLWTEFMNDDRYKCAFRNLDEEWTSNFKELKLYIEKYNQIPSSVSKIKEVRTLGQWFGSQRHKYKNKINCMKDPIKYQLWTEFMNDDRYKKYFMSNEEEWNNNFEESKLYIEKYGARPSYSSKIKTVKALGYWIDDQRHNYKNKIASMSDPVKYQLWTEFMNDDRYKYVFRNFDEIWNQNFEESKLYIEKYNARPSSESKIKEIKLLGGWFNNQINHYKNKNNSMNDPIKYQLWTEFITSEKYKIYFMSNEEEWNDKLEELKKYIDKYNRTPIQSSGNEILGKWLSHQLQNYKSKKQIMKNPQRYNKWTEFITSEKYKIYFMSNDEKWNDNLEKVKKYIDENNKRPSKHDKNKDIKLLGGWISTQNKTYKSKDNIMKDPYKQHLWYNFITNPLYSQYFDQDISLPDPLPDAEQSNNPLDEYHPIERRDIVSRKDIEDERNNISALTSILNRYENKMNIDNSSIQERLDGRPKRRNKANRQEMFQE